MHCEGPHDGHGAQRGPWREGQCRLCWRALNPERAGRPPGLLAQAGNFVRAGVAHVLAGAPQLPADQVAARLAVCGGCEEYLSAAEQCKVCGCHLPTKASWADMDCPLGRWPKVERAGGAVDLEHDSVRHLLYHVYPRREPHRGEAWRWNVEQLRQRLHLFNGQKIVAVVTDDSTDSPGAVRAALAGWGIEWLELPNDPARREVASHEALFSRLADCTGPGDVTLWAHAKGVANFSWPDRGAAIRLWTQTLYESYLDYWPVVAEVLATHPLAGSLRRRGHYWPQSVSAWHYAGSWAWFRNAELFARDWRHIDQITHGIETFWSLHFGLGQAGVILGDLHQPGEPSWPYHKHVWDHLAPELESWRAEHAAQRTSSDTARLCLDLGCGQKCQEGHVGVDAQAGPGVAHVCDFETLHPGGDGRLPFADGSVAEVYSSHCLEHVDNLKGLLWEIARVCRVGARVEIRVPHHLSAMALAHGHRQVIPPQQVEHWCSTAVPYWWQGSPRRLRHLHSEALPGEDLARARPLFRGLTDEQLMAVVPGCAHEWVYVFEVIANEEGP